MRSRLTTFLLLVAILLGVHSVARTQQNPYRLKEPDQRKLCLECHSDFEQKLKARHVHTAVKTGDCSGCHSPHVSSHGKLLADDPSRVCASCHDSVVPANAASVHQVVADGQCQKCHDPHASEYADNLVASGNTLCFGCHKDTAEAVSKAKFKHSPVEEGCVSCHGPHGSEASAYLLKRPVPDLCVSCHNPSGASFAARHMKYPVAKASCTGCHDPHGSDTPALLFNNVHAPVSSRTCSQCHEAPDSPTPFATKQPGYELCKGCHGELVNTTMAQARLHWPVADKKGCVNCHNPHASKHANLLAEDTPGLCRTCHEDTLRKITAVTVKHAPVESGTCVACHSPHAAEGIYLMNRPSVIETCAACHDYEQHSAHPIGEAAVDQRNKNLRVDCLSCHDGHGTNFKWMLLAETNVELCTRCHKQVVR